MTNHTYFNLNGHDSDQSVLNHEVKIFADNYLVSNKNDWLTTGETKSVKNTRLDFRNYTKLKDRIKLYDISDGYNDYFIVNQQSGKKYSARYFLIIKLLLFNKELILKCEKSR
jgi:galactose mutarotase-like enzyme